MNKLKLIICATFGNCFEIYDFVIYQLLATHISKHFFDKNSAYAMIWTQVIFALTVIISRPLGGIIFGYLSDIRGRKLSLEKSVLLSGLATGMIGLIPDYEQIGCLATILLILLRFLQGVSLGGEQGASIAFLLEHASPRTRGFLTSFCCFGQQLGILLAIIVTTVYSNLFHGNEFTDQLWRILFILSFGVGALGYWIRKKTNETIDFLLNNHCALDEQPALFKQTKQFLINNKSLFLSAFLIVVFGVFVTYTVFIIGNSYLKTHAAKLPVLQHIQYIMSVSVILSIPVFGYLSDKFGRKPIVSFSLLAIFGLSLRFFQSLNTANSFNDVVIAILLAVSCGGYFAVAPTIIIESLPSKARCICFALFYTIPAAIVSGVTPYLTSWLIALNPIFITYAIIVLGIAAHLALRVFNEPVLTYKRLPKYSYEFLKP